MSLIERITAKVEKLDHLCHIIPEELMHKRDERTKWNSWHSEWKKHGLNPILFLRKPKKKNEELRLRLQLVIVLLTRSLEY